MTLQAEQVHLVGSEKSRAGGPMRGMAADTAFRLHRQVLVNERSTLVGVAFETHLVLRRARSELPRHESAVLVVAIGALNQAFVDPVVEGTCELRTCLRVAGIAKLRLIHGQQAALRFGMVGGMAAQAAYIVFRVGGAQEVGMLIAVVVATQAAFTRLFRAEVLEADDLADIAAAGHVLGPGSVAVLAAMFPVLQQCVVGRSRELLVVQVLVASLAGVRAYVLPRFIAGGIRRRLPAGGILSRGPGYCKK